MILVMESLESLRCWLRARAFMHGGAARFVGEDPHLIGIDRPVARSNIVCVLSRRRTRFGVREHLEVMLCIFGVLGSDRLAARMSRVAATDGWFSCGGARLMP